jgi:hypothetical protein
LVRNQVLQSDARKHFPELRTGFADNSGDRSGHGNGEGFRLKAAPEPYFRAFKGTLEKNLPDYA